ncbi:MAG: hypothetical protein AB1791_01960 [Chloroflexota bacterium]
MTAKARSPLSGDWRFLPGVPAEGSLLLIGSDEALAGHLALSYEQVTPMNATQVVERLSVEPAAFDLVAIPDLRYLLNLTAEAQRPQRIFGPVLQAAHRLSRPGGVLYVGFGGRWPFRRLPWGDRQGFTAGQVGGWLRRAGFSSLTYFGAIPDHRMPLYLFPLQGAATGFVLGRHLKKLRPAWLREWLARPGLARWGQAWLPGYAIVAKMY